MCFLLALQDHPIYHHDVTLEVTTKTCRFLANIFEGVRIEVVSKLQNCVMPDDLRARALRRRLRKNATTDILAPTCGRMMIGDAAFSSLPMFSNQSLHNAVDHGRVIDFKVKDLSNKQTTKMSMSENASLSFVFAAYAKQNNFDTLRMTSPGDEGCALAVGAVNLQFLYEGVEILEGSASLKTLGLKEGSELEVRPCRRSTVVVVKDLTTKDEMTILASNASGQNGDTVPFAKLVELYARNKGLAVGSCKFVNNEGDKFVRGTQCFMQPVSDVMKKPMPKGNWSNVQRVPGLLAHVLQIVGRENRGIAHLTKNVLLVCKEWHQVCAKQLVIDNLDMSFYPCNSFSDEMLAKILKFFKSTKAVDFSGGGCCGSIVTDDGIRLLVDLCKDDLTVAQLSGCGELTDVALAHLARCGRLHSLFLGNSSHGAPNISGRGLQLLLESSSSLTTLDLSSYTSGDLFDALSTSSSLKHLTFKECKMDDAGLTKVAKCSQLLSLDITKSMFTIGDTENHFENMFIFPPPPPPVHPPTFELGGITDAGISALATGCRSLIKLNLNSCMRISDAGLASISTGMAGLKELRLSKVGRHDCYEAGFAQVSDVGIARLCQGCKHLSDLDLSACYALSDAGLFAIASLTGLTSLTIMDQNENANGMSDILPAGFSMPLAFSFLAAAQNGNQQKSIFADVTTAGLVRVVSACPFLANLDVSALAHAVDDATLIAIGTHSQRVEHLRLGTCSSGLTGDLGFAEIAKGCPLLRTFDLKLQRQFPDELFLEKIVSLFSMNVAFPRQRDGVFRFRDLQQKRTIGDYSE
jgi:hypothetical protein